MNDLDKFIRNGLDALIAPWLCRATIDDVDYYIAIITYLRYVVKYSSAYKLVQYCYIPTKINLTTNPFDTIVSQSDWCSAPAGRRTDDSWVYLDPTATAGPLSLYNYMAYRYTNVHI